jgi:TetR/AcrR family transcriptional regulator, regulator of autoinduction and epiphytic fitness
LDQNRPKRTYNSQNRQKQAQNTRLKILEAARDLFTERGYAGTTIDAIAGQAGVAVETVYAAFGSKRNLLARLVDFSVAGDEEPAPLLDRAGPQAVFKEADQHKQVRLFAHDLATIMGRMGVIFEILRAAAKTESEIAVYLDQLLQGRMQGMQYFIRQLLVNGPLRDGLNLQHAAETVWAITSGEIYRLLTVDLGWTAEQYENWLGDTLEVILLPD